MFINTNIVNFIWVFSLCCYFSRFEQVKVEVHLLMGLLTAWCIFGGIVVIFLPDYNGSDKEAVAEDRNEER